MQTWKKIGLIFAPYNNSSWMVSHAANPIAEYLYDDIFRVYFNTRDKLNRSSITFIDFDICLLKVVNLPSEALLTPGEIGTFDDNGVSLGCIKNINGEKYIFYLGWNLCVTVPWRNSIGLAIQNNGIFERYSLAPIIDRSNIDPFSISYPYVLEDNNIFKMWYGSNLSWGKNQSDMKHVIKYAESSDGINWIREGKICINLKNNNEYAISKPFVLKEDSLYKMWYCYRGKFYKIGYAESSDGINWIRKDEEISLEGSSNWDNEMNAYPFIIDHKNVRYMFYNGNSYGKSGIGLAYLSL